MSNEDAKPLEHDALTSWHGCGCMSQALVIREGSEAEQAALRKEAAKRKCVVRLIRAGEMMPPWECEAHQSERLARMARKARNTTPAMF